MISYSQIAFAAFAAMIFSLIFIAPVYSQNITETTTYSDGTVSTQKQYTINQSDRILIRDYINSTCPAGQMISPNGCVPIANMRQTVRTTTYTVGQPLANTVTYTTLPAELMTRLHPAPTGYEYAMIDGDVVLLSPANRQVMDAVPRVPEQ